MERIEKLSSYWALPTRILFGIAFMIHGAPKLFSAAEHAGFAADPAPRPRHGAANRNL